MVPNIWFYMAHGCPVFLTECYPITYTVAPDKVEDECERADGKEEFLKSHLQAQRKNGDTALFAD